MKIIRFVENHFTLVKFMVVGGIGAIFIETGLYLFAHVLGNLPTLLIFLELSIFLNFALNSRFTFKGDKEKSLKKRFGIFQVTSLLSYSVNVGVFTILSAHMTIYIAEFIAILLAFMINYGVSSKIIFLQKSEVKKQ